MREYRVMAARLCAAVLVAVAGLVFAPLPCAAQNQAAKAPAKLSRPMQKALADHRRNVGRALRGGPEDYYVVVLGEITDRPREPNLLDVLHATTGMMAVLWDIAFTPLVILTGDGEELLVSQYVPPMRSSIERTYQHEVRIVHTKAAAIEAVFDYTTALVQAPPQPPEQRYRAWAFAGRARTEAAAQEAKTAVDAKLAAMAARPVGFLEQAHQLLDGLDGDAPPVKAEPKVQPKQAPPDKAGKDKAGKDKAGEDKAGAARERIRKVLEEARQKPEGLEKLRAEMQREFFGAPP